MAKDKCTLTDAELIEKDRDWISKLAETGGREWCLRIPVDFNHDPDMIFAELCNRLEGAKTTEQPTSEDVCKAALLACLEALEVAQGYVESSGWTRHRDADIAQVESAVVNARKALEE